MWRAAHHLQGRGQTECSTAPSQTRRSPTLEPVSLIFHIRGPSCLCNKHEVHAGHVKFMHTYHERDAACCLCLFRLDACLSYCYHTLS